MAQAGGWSEEYEAVRSRVADLLGASAEEIALIHNTTEGMNLVASSLDLEPGDEVILADHEHTSGTIPWRYWQEPKGVKLVQPTLPILTKDPSEIVEVYRAAFEAKETTPWRVLFALTKANASKAVRSTPMSTHSKSSAGRSRFFEKRRKTRSRSY